MAWHGVVVGRREDFQLYISIECVRSIQPIHNIYPMECSLHHWTLLVFLVLTFKTKAFHLKRRKFSYQICSREICSSLMAHPGKVNWESRCIVVVVGLARMPHGPPHKIFGFFEEKRGFAMEWTWPKVFPPWFKEKVKWKWHSEIVGRSRSRVFGLPTPHRRSHIRLVTNYVGIHGMMYNGISFIIHITRWQLCYKW